MTIIDFDTIDTRWQVVNDGVMGGLSQSGMRVGDGGTGVFEGELSLENNGGFASVRALLGPTDLSEFSGVALRVRGDGRTYQLRFRLDNGLDGVAYRATFDTGDEWSTVTIPFASFVPTFRGRILTDRPPLDPSRIHQLTFMLADKTAGPFLLEVDWVKATDG